MLSLRVYAPQHAHASLRAARTSSANERCEAHRRPRAPAATSCATFCVALGIGVAACARISRPLLDLAQPMAHRVDQQLPALRVVEQVVLQVRIALDDPDVAQHLEQHPRRATGAPLAAQLVQQRPTASAPEQADDDLAVGERRVVVRDLAQPRRVGRRGVACSRTSVLSIAFMGSDRSYRSAT